MYNWDNFVRECSSCTRCALHENRKNVVIGRGNMKSAPILFIGEGPGEQEDIQGKAFVGRAGKLLDLVLEAQEISQDEYYIANIVKCRPPNNRAPSKDEIESCLPWLRHQVKVLNPSIIVCLGSVASKVIIDPDAMITKIRGIWIDNKSDKFSIMPTFHPAAIFRDSRKKEDLYLDIKKVRDRLRDIT